MIVQWAPVPSCTLASFLPGLLCHKILFQHGDFEMADCVKTLSPRPVSKAGLEKNVLFEIFTAVSDELD